MIPNEGFPSFPPKKYQALPRLHRERRGEAAQFGHGATRRSDRGHAQVSQERPGAEGGLGGELDRGQDQDQGGLQGDRGDQPVNYDRTL